MPRLRPLKSIILCSSLLLYFCLQIVAKSNPLRRSSPYSTPNRERSGSRYRLRDMSKSRLWYHRRLIFRIRTQHYLLFFFSFIYSILTIAITNLCLTDRWHDVFFVYLVFIISLRVFAFLFTYVYIMEKNK